MKKGIIIGVSIFVLVIVGILLIQSNNNSLSEKKILEITKPEVNSYCQELNDEAIYSHCIICHSNLGDNFTIEELNSGYNVTYYIQEIAGRNDRPTGYSVLSFELDKKGNILNSSVPEVYECSYQ